MPEITISGGKFNIFMAMAGKNATKNSSKHAISGEKSIFPTDLSSAGTWEGVPTS